MFSLSYPLCSAIAILFLHLFVPKKDIHRWIIFWFAMIVSYAYLASPSLHSGQASGIFIIKTSMRGRYYAEASSLYSIGSRNKYRNLSCVVISDTPLEINQSYILHGKTTRKLNQLIFKVEGNIYPAPTSSLTRIKQKLRTQCHEQILNRFINKDCGSFAASLILGTPLPKSLRETFRNKGLAHLFAISGWHFTLFSSYIFLCSQALPRRCQNIIALTILSLITIIFPSTPSVWRAWLSFIFMCLSGYFPGYCSGLNRLGISCIVCSLMFSPLSPSFSLSFLATLGILLFFQPIFYFFYTPWTVFLPYRLLPLMKYMFGSLSLSLSANIFLWIPMLHYFGTIPLDGIIYNLFFPLTIPVIIACTLLSLIFPFFSSMTEFLIQNLLSLPILHSKNLLVTLRMSPPQTIISTLSFFLIFILGIYLRKSKELEKIDNIIN